MELSLLRVPITKQLPNNIPLKKLQTNKLILPKTQYNSPLLKYLRTNGINLIIQLQQSVLIWGEAAAGLNLTINKWQ